MTARRIAFVLPYPYVDSMGCYREPVAFLADLGWQVDLYITRSAAHPVPYFGRERVRLRFISHTKAGLATLVGGLVGAWPRYRWVIAASPWGLHYSALACRASGADLICLHDEIPSAEYEQSALGRKWRTRERRAHARCRFTLALSGERGEFIRRVNRLPATHPIHVLPNGYRGNPVRHRSRYYRDCLGIDDDTRIVLHAGGLVWPLANELSRATADWEAGWALVFQGRLRREATPASANGRVYYSEAVLPADMMHYAVSSADIGVALYEKRGPHERLMGTASGKIGLYLHNGLPIITTDQSCYAWIDEVGCGIRVSQVSDVPCAARAIAGDYARYSARALEACRQKYNVDERLEHLGRLLG